MGRRWLLLSLGLVGALGGCDLPLGSNEESQGLGALQAARETADGARYLVALDTACCDRDGNRLRQRLQFAPGLTRISQNGRVRLWERRDVSYTLREGRRCYERHTEFERADTLEVRSGIVMPRFVIHEAELDDSDGDVLIRYRGPVSERGARVEGRLYLDRAGRPVRRRERIAWAATGRPYGSWYGRRYRYPAKLDLGPPPGPLCKTAVKGPASPRPLAGHPG
jgi:hypothetical protein